jgi:hypothetical protein
VTVKRDYAALLAAAEALKSNIGCLSENCETDDEGYSATRVAFMKDTELRPLLPQIVVDCRRLGEMWEPLKAVATGGGSWSIRRQYLTDEFAPLLVHLEQKALFSIPVPHQSGVAESLRFLDSGEVTELWTKAIERCSTDPEGAITAARSLIESACKHILDELQVPYGDSDDAPSLYKKVAAELNLAPDQHAEQVFKQTLSGVVNVVNGLSGVANKYGDRHGGGIGRRSKPSPRHARLVVNAAGTITAFVVDTWVERKR